MIVYVIGNFSGFNSGHGGHYYSVLHTAQQMKQYDDTIIYSVGQEQPSPLRGCEFATHIFSSGPACQVSAEIRSDLASRGLLPKVRIVHGFDYNSSITSLALAKELDVPFVLTKCGGSPISRMKPVFPNTLLFHEMDLRIFKARAPGGDRIRVIPNRVAPIGYDQERAIRMFGPKKDTVLFKIGRIGKAYEKSISEAIDLAIGLNKAQAGCTLHIIGYVEDRSILDNLRGRAAPLADRIKFHTEPDETRNAAELLGYCDAAVATGRGAMEAMSLGKIVLFPCANTNVPCILDEATWRSAAEENFSERVVLPENLRQFATVARIADVLASPELSMKTGEFGRSLFKERYCAIEGARIIWNYYNELIDGRAFGHKPLHVLGDFALPLHYSVLSVAKKMGRAA